MSEKDARVWFGRLARREPQELAPKRPWDDALSEAIRNADFGETDGAKLLRSALLLWNDDLNASHDLSQHIETPTGSLLHGIMHRMEGDYGNAEYWFRRAGSHPLYREIADAAQAAEREASAAFCAGGEWDPYAFNRAVEQVVKAADETAAASLRRLQHAEMATLAHHCLEARYGGPTVD